ncbi:MAG: DUF2093 domain-containing protein [Alphaproteobacteria bacterium]|jgi:hypothetical protein|nr:DUF2093 domain-containing protein [Alphaproteobacteria bacterium]
MDVLGREAVIRYEANDFTLLQDGRFVRCAVTGQPIALDRLRYWSVELQEAYASPEVAFKRWQELNAAGRV